LVLLSAPGCALIAAPKPPLHDSESARRFKPGPYHVESADVVFEDEVRGRTLASTLWWPVDAAGPAPLVVQTHGFLANRSGSAYAAKHLASYGYVVVAATHPNTTLFSRGGAKVEDVVRQPGDVSFLIDQLLADGDEVPPYPRIDPARIAVMGHSLGGVTATLAAFHPRLGDPRIAAAISIAGPMEMFEPSFFGTAEVPFLMIAGTGDVIVDYRRNAFVTLDLVPGGTLVLIAGASHTGFDDAMAGLPRLLDNPDVVGCWVLHRTLRLDAALTKLREFAQDGDGVILAHGITTPCVVEPPPTAMDPVRQHMITTLAVTAFLESRFAPDPTERIEALRYLTENLSRDFSEVSVTMPRSSTTPDRG
jgi:predicted dienelactone hydrolase